MFGTLKLKGLTWSVTISLIVLLTSCGEVDLNKEYINGKTQGTTYEVILVGDEIDLSEREVDSVLHAFDMSLSTYDAESVISRLNAAKDSITVSDPSGFFKNCYLESQEIYKSTNGLFDPSVYPLVAGWGFMSNMETPLDQTEIDSILQFVSFEEGKHFDISFDGDDITLIKKNPNFKLDFNAIAQGYSVDVLYDYIEAKGHRNFYVEIGGEIRVKGRNHRNTPWHIGVDTPLENLKTRERDTIIKVSDKGLATSGNYRKFYVKDGVKYSHTLHPKTGKPVVHTLLSATVLAEKCSTADAYATAFMVMGLDKSKAFVKAHPELELGIYLLYADSKGKIRFKKSKGFYKYLK